MANVNRPTDTAQKEQDINQKLQFYGIYSAFSNGKVPSNKQIDVALNSLLASRAMANPSKNLSAEGRGLVEDVREVVKQAQRLLLAKNQGNLIQEFVWDAQGIDGNNAATPNAPVDKATAQQHGDQALEGLKTLGRLIISNGQFRKLLDDATVLIRDMAGDAAQTAANKVNPDEQRLKSIDEPAADNTWHDVPDLSRENLKGQASQVYNQNKPFSRQDVKDAANAGMNTAQNHPSQDNQRAGQDGLRAAADHLQGQSDQNVDEDTKRQAREAKDNAQQATKNYLQKKMPKERREQTIWRLKKMLVEIQGHSDYQQAIETLLNLAQTYAGHTRDIANQTAGTVQSAHGDSNLQRVEKNLKTLVERFANYTSTDDLFDSLNQLYRDADRDPKLKGWFQRTDKYIRRCLREQGYVLKDESTREWNELSDEAEFLFRDRYRDHSDHILDEVKFLSDQFDKDPQNHAFAQSLQQLFLDLGRDENGKVTFKPHLITDLTDVIIPAIFENVRYVPIPRIEVSDPMVDVVVENLVIESDNLFPNSLEFSSDNYFRFGRRNVKSHKDNKVMIAGSGIQMDLRDVAYYLKKKQGFPSITDKGLMDIILAGEGFSFKLAARNAQKTDRTHFIAVDKVDVQVKNLAIKIKQSNHKLLFNLAKPLLLKVMRPVIQKILEKQIKDNFEKADAYMYEIYQEVQKGAEAAKDDPENAQNIFQQYVNAFQAKLNRKKAEAKNKTSNTDINLAMTKQDSMFKHIALPGGISTKATEYKELAARGNRWESPVFSIGSARESTSLPQAQQITRKPHRSTPAGVRGGDHPNPSDGSTPSRGLQQGMTGAAGLGATQPGYGSSSAQSGYGTGVSNTGVGSTGMTTSGAGYSSATPTVGSTTGAYQGIGSATSGGYGQNTAATSYNSGAGNVGSGSLGLGSSQPTTTMGTTSTGAGAGLGREMDSALGNTVGTSPGAPITGGSTFYSSATTRQ